MTEDNLPEQYTAGPTSISHRQTMLAPDQFYKIETHDRRCRNRYPVSLEIEYMILAAAISFAVGTAQQLTSVATGFCSGQMTRWSREHRSKWQLNGRSCWKICVL